MDSINPYNSLNPAFFDIKPNANTSTKGTGAVGVSTGDAAKIDKAASEFEALFINHMLKTMRESSMKNELFDGGKGEEIYTSMLDNELSMIMSQGEGMGLKKNLIAQLLSQTSKSEPVKEIKNGEPGSIKPVLNNKAALKEFQSHLKADEFRTPVKGEIISGYGLRKDPVTGKHVFHSGIDIKAPEGTPVYPASAGEVIFSGVKVKYGNLVEVRHDNGYVSRYGNNNELRALKGGRVNPLDIIALVGSSEAGTGAHLHFETIVEGYAVNPVDIVSFK